MTIAKGQPILASDILSVQAAATAAQAAALTAQNAAAAAASTATTAHTTAQSAETVAAAATAAANAALNTITPGGLPPNTIAANVSSVSAAAAPVTVTALLDKAISAATGGILYRSTAGWTALAPGIAGQVLQSGGFGNVPTWVTLPTIAPATATAPGGSTLTFGTATSATQPLTISAASGTVTSYQILVSPSAGMTFPQTWSSTTTTALISGLNPSTTYYYTVTAYNGTAAGTTSAVQSHATAAATTPPATPSVSPSGTAVTTTTGSIYDANGVTWTITSGAQVAVNGTADTTTANAIEIAYVGGLIYQENASNVWWSKVKPTDTWAQTTSPFAASTVTTAGSGTVLAGGSTNPPIVAPLSGTVAPVAKVYKTYNGMGYIFIPPANYDATKRYPVLLYMHQDDQGLPYYTSGGQSADIVGPQIDPWFNNVGFLTNFPCFVIAPLNNQSTQTYDGQINFGGYGNGTQVAQTNGIEIIKQVIASYSIDTARIYVTGNSMGGTGAIVDMLLNNTINGTVGKVFAAGLSLSGVDYDAATGTGENYTVGSSAVTQFQAGIPLISIHGSSDTDQPATRFSLPLYNQLGGTGGNAAGMALSRAGTSNYYLLIDSTLGHDTWDTYYVWPRAQTYFNKLFSYSATGTVAAAQTFTVSPNNTVVTTVGSAITDASGNAWTITSGAVMALNGSALGNTANVTKLAYVNGTVWQQNTAGNWYSVVSVTGGAVTFSAGTTTSPLPSSTPAVTGTGKFHVSGGKIIDPNGNVFIARGINVYDSDMANVVTNTAGAPLLTLFPGLNFIRLATYSYQAPSYFSTFISRLTALGVVVEIEHHIAAGGGVTPLSGSALTDESNWFASLATAYANNPYVWFGTLNEPGPPGNSLSAEHLSNYNAIRNAGNTSIIMHNPLGDYNTGVLVLGAGHGLTSSTYATMTNIVWDVHIYNGLPDFNASNGTNSYSTDQTYLNSMVLSYAQQAQTITSADGTIPVIIGEYGIATDGQNVDPGGTQTCKAVQASGFGSAAWNWASGAPSDNLTDGSGHLTSYGQQVAGWIASAAA